MRMPSDECLRERAREEHEFFAEEFDLGLRLFQELPPRDLLAAIKDSRAKGVELKLRPIVAHGYLFARDLYSPPVNEVAE